MTLRFIPQYGRKSSGYTRRVPDQERGRGMRADARLNRERIVAAARELVAEIYDEVADVSLEDAVRVARELATREGILAGISSGAIVHAALEIARRPESAGKTIVAIVCDFGERYLSTVLFEGLTD